MRLVWSERLSDIQIRIGTHPSVSLPVWYIRGRTVGGDAHDDTLLHLHLTPTQKSRPLLQSCITETKCVVLNTDCCWMHFTANLKVSQMIPERKLAESLCVAHLRRQNHAPVTRSIRVETRQINKWRKTIEKLVHQYTCQWPFRLIPNVRPGVHGQWVLVQD